MPSWNKLVTSGSEADLKSVQTEKISGNFVSMEAQKFRSTGSFSVGSNQFDISNPLYTNSGGTGNRMTDIAISGEITDARVVDGDLQTGAVYFLPNSSTGNNLDVTFDFGDLRHIKEVRIYPFDVNINLISFSTDNVNFTKAYDVNDNLLDNTLVISTFGSGNTKSNVHTFHSNNLHTGRFWKIEFSRTTSGYLNEVEFKIKEPGFVVREDFLFESGSLFVNNGDILPSTDKGSNLGSEERRFANIYAGDLELSNEDHPKGGNEIDGTKGKWTIQEGEDDLFLINRKSGKRYKFLLQNIDD